MCGTCGCGDSHHHGHVNEHSHEHEHPHHAEDARHSRLVALEQNILAKNDQEAAYNRGWLDSRRITALNLISSPGSGKTLLLEKTLEALEGRIGCAVIVGDQHTDNDARRLSGKGALVKQLETGNTCHLEAVRIRESLTEVVTAETRLLFIENVGNLICPAAFQLGENAKVALLSVTEGEDKPVKYPVIFACAEIVLITKTDLAEHAEWNRELCLQNIKKSAPGAQVFELSAKTGLGMDEWLAWLKSCVASS